ncbi:unnamed protein product [Caenorhabditis auriculariae]|uniref:Uncharacterized protein n=1 Tax=Caenorhabditis auriculariae TaxID=2777116 RepID=A0A8S1H4P7_9PELO|nr:unnamed protein product [Caenorhabditis auriculariae]
MAKRRKSKETEKSRSVPPRRGRTLCCCSSIGATLSPADPKQLLASPTSSCYGGIAAATTSATATAMGGRAGSGGGNASPMYPATTSRRSSLDTGDEATSPSGCRHKPSSHFVLELPAVSNRLRKLSEAFFNAQHGDKIGQTIVAKVDLCNTACIFIGPVGNQPTYFLLSLNEFPASPRAF